MRVAVLGGIVAFGATAAGCTRHEATAATRPLPEVVVVEAVKKDVPEKAEPNGTTRALQQVTIQARVRGFLTEKHFTEGTSVQKGQLLFVIDEDPFKIQRDAAKAKLEAAESALAKAKQSKAPEVVAAQLALDKAQLSLAAVQEQRASNLFTRSAVAKGDLDQAQADRDKWTAQVAGDTANLEQSRADYVTNIRSAQADVDAARAALGDAALNLGYCRMTSPIVGRIGEAKVKLGNLVGPSSTGGDYTQLATVQQLDPMGVDVQVPSRYLDRATRLVREGLPITIVRPGLEGEPDRPHKGVVNFIDNAIDSTTSTFLARADIANPELVLLPGEYVRADMTVGTRKGVVVVPEGAVVETQAGPTVYTVDEQGVVHVTPVKASITSEGYRVIDSGLEPGQKVIVEGLQLVRPNAKVKTKPLASSSAPTTGSKGGSS
jgi:membrane fusion protein (multidrug efflux system)